MSFFFFLTISTLLCLLMAILPQTTFVVAILWGASLILAALYIEKQRLLLIFLINFLAIYSGSGAGGLFFYVSFFGTAAIVISYLINQGKGYYEVQKWGLISACIGVSIFLVLIYFSTGDIGIKSMETQVKSYMADSLDYYANSGMLDFYEKQGMMRADFEEKVYSFATAMAKHLPAIYYLQAIMAVFFMLLLASRVSLNRGFERLKKRPYNQEIMPWQIVWVAIAGLLLWLIGQKEMSLLYYAGSNILVVLVPITVYFGLAALIYKLRRPEGKVNKPLIALLVFIGILFPLSAVMFFSLLGLFDALLDIRKLRRIEKEDI